jgi:hypothetical protein
MYKILDYFNSNPFKLNIECFTNCNLQHLRPELLKISVPISQNPFVSEDKFILDFSSMLVSNFSQEVSKKVVNHIFSSEKKTFIDLTNRFGDTGHQFQNQSSKSRKIISKILYDIPQKYLVTCGRISSDYFMDSSAFINFPFDGKVSNYGGLMYPIGSIQLGSKREVWIDPFMRWDDNFIICFDEIRVDVSNFHSSIFNESTFSPKLQTMLDFRFEVINPEVFFIFEDDYMKNWDIQSIVKQENRDKKIDYILNEDREFGSNSQFGFYFDDKLES